MAVREGVCGREMVMGRGRGVPDLGRVRMVERDLDTGVMDWVKADSLILEEGVDAIERVDTDPRGSDDDPSEGGRGVRGVTNFDLP